ncbi:hypothetical protein [uncultured Abyssibacter sp.]|uniref:hypothetical protein n=1 Tax=uncultured Abyssibacter sp. TaxID=2320202 RepID=UPI0032B16912
MKLRTVLTTIALLLWAICAWFLGDRVAYPIEFRVNNFNIYPGAGSIQRNAEGDFFHVLPNNTARQIYPTLAPPTYFEQCPECRLVREDQLSSTNDFCATASRADLPDVSFEVPCATGITLSDGAMVIALTIFGLPLAGLLIIIGIRRGAFKPREIKPHVGRGRFDGPSGR